MSATDTPRRFCECGCDESVVVPRRFVKGHNFRLQRPTPTPQQRFWENVEQDESSTCLIWTGYRNPRGHGQFSVGGRLVLVHRWVYEQVRGPIPEGLVIHHVCQVPACQNVLHMRVMTPAEHSHQHQPRSATCVRCGNDDWYFRPNGERDCNTCRREQRRRWYGERRR